MGFNKEIVPEVEILKTFLKENGSSLFYQRWVKGVDVIMGDIDGIDYIEFFEIKYYESDSEFYELD